MHRQLNSLASAVGEVYGGSQNLKIGHVTVATLPYDVLFIFDCHLLVSVCASNFDFSGFIVLNILML